MDITALAGMLFSLLMVLLLAGSILMFPLMRQLGKLLGQRIEERREGTIRGPQAEELVEAVESLRAEVERLAERQAFTDRLLEGGREQAAKNAATAAEPSEAGDVGPAPGVSGESSSGSTGGVK